MLNNKFAPIFRESFISDVLDCCPRLNFDNKNNEPERLQNFIQALNLFLRKCGEKEISTNNFLLDEKKVINYSNFLRGYMRNAQDTLKNISPNQTFDNDLIDLFKASSQYIVSCNNQVKGYKNIYDDNETYRFWKIKHKNKLHDATLEKQNSPLNENKKNLFLFMPFRVKDTETELSKYLYDRMRNSLDEPELNQADIYVAHFPISKSRCAKVYSTLMTIKHPTTYYEPQDVEFVSKHLLNFIGKDLQIDAQGKVLSGEKYTTTTLEQNFSNITMLGYCSSTADVHRCLNVVKKVGSQLYDEAQIKKAMQNIFVVSYGFLPIQQELPYSGAHFISNYADDTGKAEPFVKLNNPELYEQTKYTPNTSPAKITTMPDNRNYVIALKLNPELMILDKNMQILKITDEEHGHNINHVTAYNLKSTDNYPHQQFCTVLHNASLGNRGKDIFAHRPNITCNNMLVSMFALSQRKKMK